MQAGSLILEGSSNCQTLKVADSSSEALQSLERNLNTYASLVRLLINATCGRLHAAKAKQMHQQQQHHYHHHHQQQQQQQQQDPTAPTSATSCSPGAARPSGCSDTQAASSADAAQLQDAAVLAISACRFLHVVPNLVSHIQQQRCVYPRHAMLPVPLCLLLTRLPLQG